MARHLLVVICCLVAAPALAAGPQGVDTLMRNYAAPDIEAGKIQVNIAGDVAYVSGSSPAPWLDVWRRTAGEWKRIAEVAMTELAPLRFGAKRHRSCRGTS